MTYDSSSEPPVYDFSQPFDSESKLLKALKELFKLEEYKPVKNENSKHK